MNQLAPITTTYAPALIAATGPRASYRFLEFFTAKIRTARTRRGYARAVEEFFDWLAAKGVTQLDEIASIHVATYIEELSRARSAPTAKLRLAALRHLFDWMVIGQIMPTNPAAAVRGPLHIVRRGKTPVLDPASNTPCRATTTSKPTYTPTSRARDSRAIRRRCCSRPTAAQPASSPATPCPKRTPT
jgi:hypothetical protein